MACESAAIAPGCSRSLWQLYRWVQWPGDCAIAPFSRLPTQERLPWEPLLTDEEVQRAQGYYGSGSAMRRAAAKLLAGQPIKASAAVGGAAPGMPLEVGAAVQTGLFCRCCIQQLARGAAKQTCSGEMLPFAGFADA